MTQKESKALEKFLESLREVKRLKSEDTSYVCFGAYHGENTECRNKVFGRFAPICQVCFRLGMSSDDWIEPTIKDLKRR